MNKNIFKTVALVIMLAVCSALNIKPNSHYVYAKDDDARLEYYDLAGSNSDYLGSVVGKYGDDLQNGLSILMSATQTQITSYADLKEYTVLTDTDPMNSNNMITLYSRDSISGAWDASVWNREHVWCKSLSNGLYTSVVDNSPRGAGTDIHHLRPAFKTYNSSRQDKPYGEVDKATAIELGNTGNFSKDGIFEPRDDIKGDVARILMYVYVRYNSNLSSSVDEKGERGNLRITDIVKTEQNSETAAWNLLIKWNEADPVDYLEMHRNNEAEKLQGNRNVFIDHPEFAKMCFGSYQGLGALKDLDNTYDGNRVSYIGINTRKATLIIGKDEYFSVTTFPENVTSPTIKWKSHDNNIVVVNDSGKAVAINDGKTIIEAYTTTGLRAKCDVEVVNTKLIFKYDGEALSNSQNYTLNIKKEITNNDITMEVMATCGSSNDGNLWLGTNNNQTNIAKNYISKNDPIGIALGLTEDKKGSVLYFNGELDNVGKVTYQQNGGQGGTYISLLYSLDMGNTYQRIGKRTSLGGSVDLLSFNFDTIERARYAIALDIANDAKTYIQAKKPSVTFYSEEVTNDELVDDLLNSFDATDFDNSVFQATIFTKAHKTFSTLSESEKNNVSENNINKMALSEDIIQGYEFITDYWGMTSEELTQEEIKEIVKAFDRLSEDAKAFVSNMKNDTIDDDNIETIKDAIDSMRTQENDDPNDPNNPNEPDEPDEPVDPAEPTEPAEPSDAPVSIFLIVGIIVGIIIIVIGLVFILNIKH